MSNRTVIIIGAGASKEVGLPTGEELKSDIANLLDLQFEFGSLKKGDSAVGSALQTYLARKKLDRDVANAYVPTAWHIRDMLPLAMSIDNFIDTHRDDDRIAFLGKLAIVRAILKAERKSSIFLKELRQSEKIDYKNISDTWLVSFFRLLTENCSRSEIKDRMKLLTLVIFNYDRCVEHFLFSSLKHYYDLTDRETVEIISNLTVLHPYGSVGSLPWSEGDVFTNFGHEPDHHELLNLVPCIKTFTEGTDPSASHIHAIRKSIRSASRIIFLGFAFHPLNMKLLKGAGAASKKNERCFATTYRISENDKNHVHNQIRLITNSEININLANKTCGEFFSEYWRSLSFQKM